MVTLWRMQVTTSCRMRRPGSWNSTSLVTTVAHAHRCREIRQLEQPELIVRPPAQRKRHIGAIAERFAQAPEAERAVLVGGVRHENRDQSLAVGDEIRPGEIALSLAGALLAEREQPAQPRIGRSIGRVDQDRGIRR